MRRDRTSRNSANLVNIAHLHVRFARQAGERDGQLGATTTLTRRKPARSILIFCGSAGPVMLAGVTLPKVVLPMVSSCGLKGLPRTNVRDNDRQLRPARIAVKRD
jgi:hypothetical protein